MEVDGKEEKKTYHQSLNFTQTLNKNQSQLIVVPSETGHYPLLPAIFDPSNTAASVLEGVFLPFGNSVLPHEDLVESFTNALFIFALMDETQMLAQMSLMPSPTETPSFAEFFTMTLEQLMQVPVILTNEFADLSYDQLLAVAVVDEGQSNVEHSSFGNEGNVTDLPTGIQGPPTNGSELFSSHVGDLLVGSVTGLFSSKAEKPFTPAVMVTMQLSELNNHPFSAISANLLDLDPPSIVYAYKVLLNGGSITDLNVNSAYQQWIGAVYKSDGLIIYTIKGAQLGLDQGTNYLILFTKDVNINDLAYSSLTVNNPFVPPELPSLTEPLNIIGQENLINIDSSFLSLIFQSEGEEGLGDDGKIARGPEEYWSPNAIQLSFSNLELAVDRGFYRAGGIAFVLGSAMPNDFPSVMIDGHKYFEIKFEYIVSNHVGSSSAGITIHIEDSPPVTSPHFNQFSAIDPLPTFVMGNLLTSSFNPEPTFFGPKGGSFTNATVNGGTTVIGSQNIIVTDPYGNQLVVNEQTGQYVYFVKTATDALNAPLSQVFHIEMTDLHGNVGVVDLTLVGNNGVTPIVLDLTGQGIDLKSPQDLQVSVTDNQGHSNLIGWVGEENGVLAYDPLGTHQVTNINQINFTSYTPGAKTDLQGLVAFDTNHNDKLDFGDREFSQFGVLLANGQFESLAQLQITAISLISDNQKSFQNGNIINGLTNYETSDQQVHLAADVIFGIGAQGKGAVLNLQDVIDPQRAANDSMSHLSATQPVMMTEIDHAIEQIAQATLLITQG